MKTKPKKLKDADYILAEGRAWITVGGFSIRIAKTDEGVAADIYKLDAEDEGIIAGTYAYDSELEGDEVAPTGTEGQDRENYSDNQDRDNYTTE